MANNLFMHWLGGYVATYWLHSTLLLGLAWLLVQTTKLSSHFVRERIWKIAAVAGFGTACLQLSTGLGVSLFESADKSQSNTTIHSQQTSTSRAENNDNSEDDLATSLMGVLDSLNQIRDGLPRAGAAVADPAMAATSKPESETPEPGIRLEPQVTYLPLDEVEQSSTTAVGSNAGDALSAFVSPESGMPAQNTSLGWQTLAGWTVMIWTATSVLYLARQTWRFRWQMRNIAPASRSHQELLVQICQRRGVTRKVRLMKSDRFTEPVAFGLRRQTILIPSQVEQQLNRDELTVLLQHELAHLIRGDIVWLVVARVLHTCFAFQPLNFVASRRWQQHAEFQCDDWAAERDTDRLNLARGLTAVAEWRFGRASCAGVASAGGNRFHISDRVERLLKDAMPDAWQRRSRKAVVYGTALLVLACVVLLGPQTGSADGLVSHDESLPNEPKFESVEHATSLESTSTIHQLASEVDGLRGDVVDVLAELRTLEPLLAELESRPELSGELQQLRSRIELLRSLALYESQTNSRDDVVVALQPRQEAATNSGGTK